MPTQIAGAAIKKFFAALRNLPSATRTSISPSTELEARQVESQVNYVWGNIRLLNIALPLAGIPILSMQIRHMAYEPLMYFWGMLALVCCINEWMLSRKKFRSYDVITRAKRRARIVSGGAFSLVLAWCAFLLVIWNPDVTTTRLFVLIMLTCTLGAMCTLLPVHLATAVGPIALVSTFILVSEIIHGLNARGLFLQLAVLYVTLMVVQAFTIHARADKAWRLKEDREQLINSLRKAKEESDQAHREALAASKAKSEFLANMSHELRTPLNAIIGFSDIVRSKSFGDTVDKYAEYAGFIHQSGHHLLDLITDILDLAKIEAGRKLLHPEPIDLASLIRDEVHAANESASSRAVTVTHVLPRTLPLLKADVHAVRQILQHLLSNAVKFSLDDGMVEVASDVNDAGEIEISITDKGLGIAEDDLAHIFARFGAGRPDVTTVRKGTGLGLPIVKGLVDMHGGRIVLESVLGEGTRVIVTFPAESTMEIAGLRVVA